MVRRKLLPAVVIAALLLCGCRKMPVLPEETAVPEPTQLQTLQTEAAATETTVPETIPAETASPETMLPETLPLETEPIPEPEDEDFVLIKDYIPTVSVELAYGTDQNFTGNIIYEFEDAYLRYGTVKKLMKAAQKLQWEGYGILVWDAYRPVYAQQRLWDSCPDPAYVSKPGTGTQAHCRGSAVDITLYDFASGEPVEMPTGFDDFSPLADRDYSDCTQEAAENAGLLENIMESCGFKPYRGEWWHFTDTDTYEIEYEFDPEEMNEY